MRITFLPQRKQLDYPGRHRVSEVLRHLNLLPGTVMVIRGDELLTGQDMIEDDEHVEIRNVISGG